MKSKYHREKIIFRFVGFPKRLLPALTGILPGVKLMLGKQKTTGRLVVSVELNRKVNSKQLCAFIRKNKISRNKYGLWVSLVTEKDSDGVRTPDFAVKLFQKTGGHLDFSFTSV